MSCGNGGTAGMQKKPGVDVFQSFPIDKCGPVEPSGCFGLDGYRTVMFWQKVPIAVEWKEHFNTFGH